MSRGLGVWQYGILDAVEDYPDGFLLRRLWFRDKPPSVAQVSARQRAAKSLTERGLCRSVLVWARNRQGAVSPQTMILPADAPDPPTIAHKVGYSFKGSDREVARRLGVSHRTVASVRATLT